MEHIKKYWWAYLILIAAIYFFLNYSMGGPSLYEDWKNRNKATKPVPKDGSVPKNGTPCTIETDYKSFNGADINNLLPPIQGKYYNGVCKPLSYE